LNWPVALVRLEPLRYEPGFDGEPARLGLVAALARRERLEISPEAQQIADAVRIDRYGLMAGTEFRRRRLVDARAGSDFCYCVVVEIEERRGACDREASFGAPLQPASMNRQGCCRGPRLLFR
jgi:hypothetical protein